MDAAASLQDILERDARARISFMKDTLPAFASSVKTAFLAAIPFRREPEVLPSGYANLLYLWNEPFFEEDF